MKVIVAPDKFKGSLTSQQVCDAVKAGIQSVFPDTEIYSFPMADGGDGFASVLKYYLQTETVSCKTVDPLFRAITAAYEWNRETKTAIIELAAASGLVLLKEDERDPLLTSTYGTGILIQHAINRGASKIILGLGGSATNDAGIGVLQALGFIFTDKKEMVLQPIGQNLHLIHTVVKPAFLPAVEILLAADVMNVLYGATGAACVYAPQKGADAVAVKHLDDGLRHFAGLLCSSINRDIAHDKGTGAAGGVAAGLSAFFKTQIISGAALVASLSGIEKRLPGTGMIITGEGSLDMQTANGKVVHWIISLAKKYKIPVAVIAGNIDPGLNEMQEGKCVKMISLTSSSISKDTAIKKAADLIKDAAASLLTNR